MGLFRKMTSVSTAGMVDFRSDKERIARYTRQTRNAVRAQSQFHVQQPPSTLPGWYPDPIDYRYVRFWDGWQFVGDPRLR